MPKKEKATKYWVGAIVFVYSLFLFCESLWLWGNYIFIIGVLLDSSVPNYQFILTLYYLEKLWAVVPSIVAGPILMMLGYRILGKTKQKLSWSGLAIFGYSFILLLQAIWATHHFYKELNWLVTTNIFINYPRFFQIVGVIVSPLVGSILFMVIGLYLMRVDVRRKQLIPSA
jgi:hypothetical protein